MKKSLLFSLLFFFCTQFIFSQNRIVGYVPSWKPELIKSLPYEKLTHINYAFISLYPDGNLRPFERAYELDELVKKAHQTGTKVLISIGGWELGDGGGNDDSFEIMASKAKTRKRFIKQIDIFLERYNLDGVDIDWEFPDTEASIANFDSLSRNLSETFKPQNKLVTVALTPADYYGKYISSSSLQYYDFINIMAYDGGEPHSSYQYAIESFNYWKNRGASPAKIVIGVPFYGKNGSTTVAYSDIVQNDSKLAEQDIYNQLEYNGKTTIKKKTIFAKENAGGIMIWEMSQDAEKPNSLLDVIYENIKSSEQK